MSRLEHLSPSCANQVFWDPDKCPWKTEEGLPLVGNHYHRERSEIGELMVNIFILPTKCLINLNFVWITRAMMSFNIVLTNHHLQCHFNRNIHFKSLVMFTNNHEEVGWSCLRDSAFLPESAFQVIGSKMTQGGERTGSQSWAGRRHGSLYLIWLSSGFGI